MVIISLNLILSLAVIHLYFNEPERDYYATDGVSPPGELVAMNVPNMTSDPLLPDDPVNENVVLSIPE